jgi:hypothetical protein
VDLISDMKNRLLITLSVIFMAALINSQPLFAGSAALSWNKLTVDSNGGTLTEVTGYKIYYGTSPRTGSAPPGGYNGASSPVSLPGNPDSPAYTFTDLDDGFIYYFSVAAYNSAGTGAFSNEAAIALCSDINVQIEGEDYYSSIQDAYDVLDGDAAISILAIGFTPRLILDKDRNVKLTGGLDCDYSSVLGYSYLPGLVITKGSAVVDRIIIK